MKHNHLLIQTSKGLQKPQESKGKRFKECFYLRVEYESWFSLHFLFSLPYEAQQSCDPCQALTAGEVMSNSLIKRPFT